MPSRFSDTIGHIPTGTSVKIFVTRKIIPEDSFFQCLASGPRKGWRLGDAVRRTAPDVVDVSIKWRRYGD